MLNVVGVRTPGGVLHAWVKTPGSHRVKALWSVACQFLRLNLRGRRVKALRLVSFRHSRAKALFCRRVKARRHTMCS